jgi:hypothetical protein
MAADGNEAKLRVAVSAVVGGCETAAKNGRFCFCKRNFLPLLNWQQAQQRGLMLWILRFMRIE